MGSIQRGDILVFSGESDSAGHVGIYLGGGKMVDASSSEGQVRLSSSVLSSGGREKMEVDVQAMHGYGLWATLQRSGE